MSKNVTFTGERTGAHITVRAFIAALEKALFWLRGHDLDSPMEWEIVRVRISSSLSITFTNASANGNISARMRNLSQLHKKRMPSVLPRLTDEDIEGTKELATVIGHDFKSMRISSPGEPTVKITPVLIERVETIARTMRANWFEWTTLRGTVDQITFNSNVHRFRLRHQLTSNEIACEFDPGLLDHVKDILSHRVEVYGRVRYNRQDVPKSIDVESIRSLPDRSPKFETVPAVDIVSGMDSADHVERVRGGD